MSLDLHAQLAEYGAQVRHGRETLATTEVLEHGELVRSIPTETTIPATPNWGRAVVVVLSAAAVVLMIGLIPFLVRSPTDDTAPATTPQSTTPTTVATIGSVPMHWTLAHGELPLLRGLGVASIVSNGSSYLGVIGPANGAGALVHSTDGVEWRTVLAPTRIESPFGPVAVGDSYLLQDNVTNRICNTRCPLLVSTNGLDWELTDSTLGSQWRLDDIVWRVDTAGDVLQSTPPDLEPLDTYESVVMLLDGRFVMFGQDHNGNDHRFSSLASVDGKTWTATDLPDPFVDVYTKEYLNAGWQWMWRCEFAARDSQGMALVTNGETQSLWTTDDGANWFEISTPPKPIDAPARGRCVEAFNDGWLLYPGGWTRLDPYSENEHAEIVTSTPGEILYSVDGVNWTLLAVSSDFAEFRGAVQVAGDSIFIIATSEDPEIEAPRIIVGRTG